jgi:hypothetical protein
LNRIKCCVQRKYCITGLSHVLKRDRFTCRFPYFMRLSRVCSVSQCCCFNVTPMMSGIQEDFAILEKTWIPAFAGMTKTP